MQTWTTVGLLLISFAAGVSGQATPCGRNALFAVVSNGGTPFRRRLVLLTLFGAGLALGASLVALVLTGMSLGLAKYLPAGQLVAVVAAGLISIFFATAILSGIRVRVPTRQWVVPRTWALAGPWLFALRFGFVLGMGFVTIVPFAGYYVMILLLLAATPTMIFASMLTFGAGRWLTTALSTVSASVAESAGYRVGQLGLTRGLGPIDRLLPVLRLTALCAGVLIAVTLVTA